MRQIKRAHKRGFQCQDSKEKGCSRTGGSSGQGLATAKRFVEEGAFVYTPDRQLSPIRDIVTAVSNLAVDGGMSAI